MVAAVNINRFREDAADRQLEPQDVEAEQGLLACVLSQPEILDELDFLKDDAFYVSKHGILMEVCRSLWNQSAKPDLITVADELTKRGKLELVGGKKFLSDLMLNHFGSAYWLDYARSIAEKHLSRQMIRAGRRIAQLGIETATPIVERIDEAQQVVYELGDVEEINHAKPAEDVCIQVMDRLERGVPGSLVGRGFEELYAVTGGIAPGELHVTIGETGMAKSHFGIAQAVSYAPTEPVLCVTVEMTEDEYMNRILAMYSAVDSKKIQGNNLTEDELGRVAQAMAKVSTLNLHIYSADNPSDAQVRSEIRRMTRYWGRPPCLVVIDYLQYLSGKGRSRVEDLDAITKSFKKIARDFKCTVNLLSQAKREVQDRRNKRPLKADSRECGAIENHANVIYGLYRDEIARDGEDDVETGTIEIAVLKQRNGSGTGWSRAIKMNFDPSITYFGSIRNF